MERAREQGLPRENRMPTTERWNMIAKKAFSGWVVMLGLLTLTSALYIEFHYSAVMPRTPQPETGRIYPKWFKSAGGCVYVNKAELDRSDFVEYRLFPLFGLSMLLGFGIGVRLGWWDIGPKGPYDPSKFRI
jgi:hypothetical protein